MDADAIGSEVVRAGELSHPLTRHELGRSLRQAVEPEVALGLCPPHRWGCPVIMKLDPDHVAWTCGRCGVVATGDDLGVTPE
ncbi:MAG: hypothetical protein ACXVH3_22260 [Solirubrobacteraceae bacterium]